MKNKRLILYGLLFLGLGPGPRLGVLA